MPKTQVKLTFSMTDVNEDCACLLQSFTELRNLTSVHLNFSQIRDISKIEELIQIFNDNKSISHLSLTISNCFNFPFSNILSSLKSIKSLKNSKIHLKNCSNLTKEGLKMLVPPLKRLNPGLQDLEIIFENCENEITPFEWWPFIFSIWMLKTSCKIKPKFIGEKQGQSDGMMMIIVLVVMFVTIGIPIMAITLS